MLDGINYLHAKFQIIILKNKKNIKLLELWTLWKRKKIANTIGCYHNSKNMNRRVDYNHLKWVNMKFNPTYIFQVMFQCLLFGECVLTI